MRYYRFTSLLLIFALCSCSRSNDKTEKSSSPLSAEQITVETAIDSDTVTTTSIKTTQSQTITATESDAPKTFPVPNGADGHEIKKHYSFKVQSDGVWVYYDDMKAQFLSAAALGLTAIQISMYKTLITGRMILILMDIMIYLSQRAKPFSVDRDIIFILMSKQDYLIYGMKWISLEYGLVLKNTLRKSFIQTSMMKTTTANKDFTLGMMKSLS